MRLGGARRDDQRVGDLGRAVARGAADSLKRVHLELGGKAPVVIFADADVKAAAESLRTAGYWNSGQECGAACRMLVRESVAEEFVDHLVNEVRTLVVGEPGAGNDVEVGPLVSRGHLDRVLGYLDRAANQGIRAAVGGSAVAGTGYFVAPTVLVDVPEPARRSSGPRSPSRRSPTRRKRSVAPMMCRSACPRRSGPRAHDAATTSPRDSTPEPCGSMQRQPHQDQSLERVGDPVAVRNEVGDDGAIDEPIGA